MDHRYIQRRMTPWFDSINKSKSSATINELEVDGDIKEFVIVSCRFDVCPTCEGKGTHVNPNIDAQGITAEEWDRDWSREEQVDYISGVFDVSCYKCKGIRVVPVPSNYNCPDILKAIEEREETKLYSIREEINEREMGY